MISVGLKLNDGSEITGCPDMAEYHKNENGLYDIEIIGYTITKSDGSQFEGIVKIPNAKLPVEDDNGVIPLNSNDIDYFDANKDLNGKEEHTIWEFVVSQ